MNPFLPLPRRAAVPTPKKFVSITHKPSRAPLCQVLPICLWSSESERFHWERCAAVARSFWRPRSGRRLLSFVRVNIPGRRCTQGICPHHVVMGALLDRFACQTSMLMTHCSTPMTRSSTLMISPNRLVGDVVQNSLDQRISNSSMCLHDASELSRKKSSSSETKKFVPPVRD